MSINNHRLSTFDNVLLSYESRKFEIVSHGWTFSPEGQTPIKSGTTQRMADCGNYEFVRIYTGLRKNNEIEFLLLRRKKV